MRLNVVVASALALLLVFSSGCDRDCCCVCESDAPRLSPKSAVAPVPSKAHTDDPAAYGPGKDGLLMKKEYERMKAAPAPVRKPSNVSDAEFEQMKEDIRQMREQMLKIQGKTVLPESKPPESRAPESVPFKQDFIVNFSTPF